jgi:hypothetical protein
MIDEAIGRSRAHRNEMLLTVTSSADSVIDAAPSASGNQPVESSESLKATSDRP